VDDDPSICDTLTTMLQFKGYRTSVARNGKEAIDIARSHPPDLVLLDVMMPEVDGVTVCRTFREDPRLRDVRILMLTARSGRQDVVRALEAGASDYVTKPFFFDELVARIRTNMEVKRYHDDLAAMLRISQAVSSSLDSDKVLYTIVSELGEVVQSDRASLIKVADRETGYVVATRDDPEIRNLRIDLLDYPEIQKAFVERHPVLSLFAGCLAATALWTQQSYAYLAVSGRLGDRGLLDLVRDDFVLVAMWFSMIPVIAFLSRRIPVAGKMWPGAILLHAMAAALLGLAHSWTVVAYRGEGTVLSAFRGSVAITLLVYLGVLAYAQRRLLEQWLAERQLASLRINSEITEAKIAAASMAVAPESLDFTLLELERFAANDPLKAEQAIARLGSELRSTLEASFADQPSGGSDRPGPVRGENRVERLAMGA